MKYLYALGAACALEAAQGFGVGGAPRVVGGSRRAVGSTRSAHDVLFFGCIYTTAASVALLLRCLQCCCHVHDVSTALLV